MRDLIKIFAMKVFNSLIKNKSEGFLIEDEDEGGGGIGFWADTKISCHALCIYLIIDL